MLVIVHLLGSYVADLFKSRHRLEVENLFLRHQLNIALRRAPQHLLCVPKTASRDNFSFERQKSLFLRQNSLLPVANLIWLVVCTENLIRID